MSPHGPGSVFCDVHALAPAGRRGGWISAQRKRTAGNGVVIDASNITRRLWIGGEPPDCDLPDFDVLVLCAQEIQPRRPELKFHGLTIHCPLPDAQLGTDKIRIALMGGHRVAQELVAGNRVLVTCAMGRNRSALVAGFGMAKIYRLSPGTIIETIRRRRHPDCLSNPHFVQLLGKYSVRH